MKRSAQSGLTLVIALVMLVVLTLLVVSAIRFGNINLKITGNVQSETEASAAAQVAVESTLKQMVASTNISAITAQPALSVSTGGQTYTVAVLKPTCVFSKNVPTTDLDPSKAADQVCFEGSDSDKLITASGALSAAPSACKDQQWDVTASVADANSGASVTMLQGAAVRVDGKVQCPL
ncbi:MAG: PilX N-terminal domain-containing pilus assembly protein [Ramlibacter sp.]